jgi:integrase/recombinase XerD
MTDLRRGLEEYLALRRGVGFKLVLAGYVLRGFVAELEASGHETVTTKAAVAWATKPAGAQPCWWAQRLGMARGFARYLHARDPAHEVPPPGLLTAKPSRAVRHVFSRADVAALMDAAGTLDPELRALTYRTLIGLLSVTGMRVGEAIGLDRGDVNLEGGLLVVRHAKFDKHREVLLHASTLAALGAYAARRDELVPAAGGPAFLVSRSGARLSYRRVHATFVGLLAASGLEARPRCRARLHDLRHSFAVTTLAEWHRQGHDVEQRLPRLATYLGHVDPAKTYWYLSATPELMAQAARRLEGHLGDLP